MLLDALNKLDADFYKRAQGAGNVDSAGSYYSLVKGLNDDANAMIMIAGQAKTPREIRDIVERSLYPRTVDEIA